MDLKFVFSIGENHYGLPVEVVDHTLPTVGTNSIPWMPSFHRGLFAYRGEIVPLLDIQPFLGVSEEGETEKGSVLIIKTNHGRFASQVRTPQFLSIPDAEWPLHESASLYPALDLRVELEGRSITLLNAERLHLQILQTLKDTFHHFHAA
jgi:chemotaxis signal transduction protein